jgi:hypothetical protein
MIKNLLKCFLLIALPQITSSQPVDLVVEVFSHYEIKGGKVMDNKRVFEENFYNPDNQIIQQLIFNDSLSRIDKFTFLFYANNSIISKETHDYRDTIVEVIRYKYSADNKLTEENIYNRQGSALSLFEAIRYKYSDSLVSEKTILDKKLKVLEKTSYTRTKDFETETSAFKNMNKSGDMKKRETKTYFNNGKKDKILVSTDSYDGKNETRTLIYSYGKKDSYNTEKITFLSSKGDTLQIKESKYTLDGKQVSEGLFDKSGNYLSYTGIERNPHKMNLGKPEMYKLK